MQKRFGFYDEAPPGFEWIYRPWITAHAKAERCYAWRYRDGKQWRYTTVLEIPPVDSAETAVKISIGAKARNKN